MGDLANRGASIAIAIDRSAGGCFKDLFTEYRRSLFYLPMYTSCIVELNWSIPMCDYTYDPLQSGHTAAGNMEHTCHLSFDRYGSIGYVF